MTQKDEIRNWAQSMANAYSICRLAWQDVYSDRGDTVVEVVGKSPMDNGIQLTRSDNGHSILNLVDALGIDRDQIYQAADGNREFYIYYKGVKFFELPDYDEHDLFDLLYREEK